MIHFLAFTVSSILGTYFAEFARENITARLLTKATPILLLAFRASVVDTKDSNYVKYGLIFSAIGDLCLISMSQYVLIVGIVSFAVAQIIYIISFGFEQRQVHTLTIAAMAGFIFKQILVKSLPFGPIKIVGAIYVLFLVIMFWRGLDIATSFSDSSGVERVSALIGSIFFVVSDFLIIYQAAHKLPYHNLIIMVTYYIAQYCITNWSMVKHIRIQNTSAHIKSE